MNKDAWTISILILMICQCFIKAIHVLLEIYQCFDIREAPKAKILESCCKCNKISKIQTCLINKVKKHKKTEKRLKKEIKQLQKSYSKIKESSKEATSQYRSNLDSRELHIARLTKRCAASEKMNADLSNLLAVEKHKVKSIEEKLKDAILQSEKLSEKLEKRALIEQDTNGKLSAQLEEAQKEIAKLKFQILKLSIEPPEACSGTPYVYSFDYDMEK